MKPPISFNLDDERISKLDSLIKNGGFKDRTDCIVKSLDFMFKTLESKHLIDFMYFVSIPFLFFLVVIGLTLYLTSLFFYIMSAISGIYLIIFFYLFYNKYRGVKWQ
jgi:hypothetical protein